MKKESDCTFVVLMLEMGLEGLSASLARSNTGNQGRL